MRGPPGPVGRAACWGLEQTTTDKRVFGQPVVAPGGGRQKGRGNGGARAMMRGTPMDVRRYSWTPAAPLHLD
eukprot:699627-Lingulodinium_polyedra.AAC.1